MVDRINPVAEEAQQPEELLAFGDFRFERSSASLYRDGDMVSLPPRSLAVLAYLLEKPGTLVSREQLIDRVWDGAYVSDQSVSEAVQVLRRGLGDDARQPIYIETVHRRGYRFIAPVAGEQIDPGGIAAIPGLMSTRSRFLPVAAGLATLAVVAALLGWALLGGESDSGVEEQLSDTIERLEILERNVGLFTLEDLHARRIVDGFRLAGRVSPDGKVIPQTRGGELVLLEWATGETDQVTHLNDREDSGTALGGSAISPDGERIAYLWLGPQQATLDLRIENVDGTGEVRIYEPDAGEDIDGIGGWTPDGQHLLLDIVSLEGGAEHRLVLYSVFEGTTRVVKVLSTRHSLCASVSPDGRWVVFDPPRDESTGERDIHLLSLEDGSEIPLQATRADETLPAWTPDGRGIVYVSNRQGTYGHWGLELTGDPPVAAGPPDLLKQDSGIARPLGFAPDGAFFYLIVTGGADIYMIARDPETGMLVGEPILVSATHSGNNLLPDWSPDGTRMAYVSIRDWVRQSAGMHYLVLPILRGGEVIDVPEIRTTLPYFRRTRWFPDGQKLMVNGLMNEDDPGSVFMYELGGGETTQLVQGPAGRPDMPADGRELFFLRTVEAEDPTADDVRGIVRIDLESPADQEVVYRLPPFTEAMGDGFSVSPDGDRLAVLQGHETPDGSAFMNEVHIVDLADGVPWRLCVLPEGKRPQSVAWSPDGRELLISMTDIGQDYRHSYELWRAPLDGADPEPLGLSMQGLRDIRIDPTGRYVAFTSGVITENGEIWRVENMLREMEPSR